jgi:hypothetical protein
MIYKCKELKYLDDRPVFAEERRFVEAFFRYKSIVVVNYLKTDQQTISKFTILK